MLITATTVRLPCVNTATMEAAVAVERPSARTVCAFLSSYAVLLFGSGATCIRIEKNVGRIARVMGMRAEFSILPRHIHITVADVEGDIATSVVAIRDLPISYCKIASLSKLSWQLADHRISFEDAVEALEHIKHGTGTNPLLLLVLVSLANASFCRLFGGDAASMGFVFAATFAGFFVKQQLALRHVDFRAIVLICAFVSAVIASGAWLFGIGSTPDLAVGTSVLYLVPGIPFINSFCDMLDRHYLCAFGRLMNAIVILCCLSMGLCAGMLVMNVGMF